MGSNTVRLSEMKIDFNLNFEKHLPELKRKVIFKAVDESQFSFERFIIKLHEKTLSLVYGNNNSRFEKQHLFTIHHQNMHSLRVEISAMR